MTFVSYPIKDMSLPASLSKFARLTHAIYEQIVAGKSTVIHCRAGIGRSGIVCAGILLHRGYTPQQAFEQVSMKRGIVVPDTHEQQEWVVTNHAAIVNYV